ncbi:fungal specific transcription factor domain-containing [Trichoderma cornu-damae]|uniref:Fungal specific transcription factor domain-containing n=1 Tax=Trichoderma cornu-damae TaxID=654480 RepID=A0A9P8QII8_9HYPO|nr:fungal specific transcription factor domain-containing [Trichoderma cornu-damae]
MTKRVFLSSKVLIKSPAARTGLHERNLRLVIRVNHEPWGSEMHQVFTTTTKTQRSLRDPPIAKAICQFIDIGSLPQRDRTQHRMAVPRRACDACYKRKIQCDRSDPEEQCNWCRHHDLPCTLNRIRGRKKKTKNSTESIVKRLERIEQGIARAKALKQSTQMPPEAAPGSAALSDSSGAYQRKITHGRCTIWFSGQKFAAICSRNGIPHFTSLGEQWIYSQTGLWPRFHNEDKLAFCEATDHISSAALALKPPKRQAEQDQLGEIPEKWVTQALLDAFNKSDFRLIFPIIDRELFEDTIRQAYDSPSANATIGAIGSRACVLAFLAVTSRHFCAMEVTKQVDSDDCAKKAQLLISDFIEDASLTTLQVMVMLVGGHTLARDPPTDRSLTVQELEERQVRFLFWLCYHFDKDMALRNGQPPMMSDEFCDLTLPKEYLENRFPKLALSGAVEPQAPFLPNDLRLSLLKSKAVSALYSAGSLRKSDAELLRTIRELDEDLENWRVSIPAEYAPALSVRKDVKLADTLSPTTSMLHIELHLDYHYLLNIIHCASGRCVVDWNESGKEMIFGLQSSLDLSVEASRSTLIYLSEAAPRLAGEAFWVFIFYPVSALLSIFFNILRNPKHEYAAHDVELLASSTKVIRSMPIHRITTHELEYLHKMDAFIEELGRLSQAAIAKVQSENGGVEK